MKVFVTVGSMLPFDRLVRAADDWAAAHHEARVVAQIGDGSFRPRAMMFESMMAPSEYRQQCANADLIVSHAGMGTVITAAEVGRPLVVLPRRPDLGEVTSNHQLATARWLADRPGIAVIESEAELAAAIDRAVGRAVAHTPVTDDCDRLVSLLRSFIMASLARP